MRTRPVFVSLLSLIAMSAHAAPDKVQLEELLGSVHEIDWAPHVSNAEDQKAVRQGLESIIDSNEARDPGQEQRYHRAIAEYGKFATQADGTFYPSSSAILKSLFQLAAASQDDSLLRVSLLRSLVNSGAPDALEMIGELIEADFPVSSFLALTSVEKMLEAETESLPARPSDAMVPYQPQAGAAYRDDLRPAWQSKFAQLENRLARVYGDGKDLPDSFQIRLGKSRQLLKAYLARKEAPDSSDTRTVEPSTAGVSVEGRSTGGEAERAPTGFEGTKRMTSIRPWVIAIGGCSLLLLLLLASRIGRKRFR